MNEYTFKLPTEIIVGQGTVNKLSDICLGFGKSLLFVYPVQIEHLALPCIKQLQNDGLNVTVFIQETPEPTINYINNATSTLQQQTYDVVIGFGGGSSIDLAKSLAISLTQCDEIWMYANLSDRPPLPILKPVLPIVAVPTTSGTGAEVTPYAVLTKTDTQQKGTIQEIDIFPKYAILDGELMIGMPLDLTASTGLDAFSHAFEATINISKASPMAELFGKEAMRRIINFLPKVIAEPSNSNYRQEMSYAATLGGMAIAHRGTTTAHAIAEPLGALTKIPHAYAVALATIPVLRHTINISPESIAKLWVEVCLRKSSGSAKEDAKLFVDFLEQFMFDLGIPNTVLKIIGQEKCDGLAEKLVDSILKFKFRPLKQHPVEFDRESLLLIVKKMIG